MTLLSELSFDVLELILGLLDAADAVACSRVCSKFHDVVATSLTIRYHLALAKHGMRPGGNGTIGVAEKLEKLERYRAAWREGSWQEFFRCKLPAQHTFVEKADGYVLAWTPETRQVRVVRLPSPLRGISLEEHTWESPFDVNNDNDKLRVLLDGAHETVVFASFDYASQSWILYPRHLLSGEVHSLCPEGRAVLRNNKFNLPSAHGYSTHHYNFYLRGRFLAIGFRLVRNGSIHDWSTGQIVCEIPRVLCALTFLDDSHVLALSKEDYGRHAKNAVLQVYDLLQRDTSGRAHHTHDFELPPLSQQVSVGSNTIALGPECGVPVSYTGTVERDQYFSEDDWAALHLPITFRQEVEVEYDEELLEMVLNIDASIALPELRRLVTQSPWSGRKVVLSWPSWLSSTWLGQSPCWNSRQSTAAGARMVKTSFENYQTKVDILDYHPRRACQTSGQIEASDGHGLYDNFVPMLDAHSMGVREHAQCAQITFHAPSSDKIQDFALSGDVIVGFKTSLLDGQLTTEEVVVYSLV